MKYHYEKPEISSLSYGELVILHDHPAYYSATLFRDGNKGIAATQQRFYPEGGKTARWEFVDKWLAAEIYLSPNFRKFFEEHAREAPFPIYEVRSLMWQLRMKPLKREEWEVYF